MGILTFICALSISVMAPAQSQEIQAEAIFSKKKGILFNKNYTSAGLATSYWYYEEPNPIGNRSFTMREFGALSGVEAEIHRSLFEHLFIRAHSSFLIGLAKYDGSLSGGKIPYTMSSLNSMFNIGLRAGVPFSLSSGRFQLSPLVGIQFRRLRNYDLPDEGADYDRTTDYYTAPVGLGFAYQVNSKLQVQGQGLYHYFYKGVNKTELSDVDSELYGNFRLPQRDGYGLEAELRAMYENSSQRIYTGKVFFRSWSIEDSDTVSGLVNGGQGTAKEPRNNTLTFGMSLSIGI